MENYTIEVGKDELQLISRALDLYSRVGLLQFDKLTDCLSLQELVWKKDIQEEFDAQSKELKNLFGYTPNASPGIFHTKDVGDDVRISANMHQTIRHKFWLDADKKDRFNHTVDAYPADICKIANIEEPIFKITNNEQDSI